VTRAQQLGLILLMLAFIFYVFVRLA